VLGGRVSGPMLSHTEDADALKNARATLAWRREKADMLEAAASGKKLERFALIEQYIICDYHGRTTSGQPMYIVRAGLSNPGAVMDQVRGLHSFPFPLNLSLLPVSALLKLT